MNPDACVERSTSKILLTVFISFFFIACENRQAAKTNHADTNLFTLKDSTAGKSDSSSRNQKTIYLTFDDGPNRGSDSVLNVVNEEQVPVTMFLIGQHIIGSPGQQLTYAHILKSPFVEVQNHSYTHGHNHFAKFYQHADVVRDDFMRCADSLHLRSNIVRTPGRNIWRTPTVSFTDVKYTSAVADTLQQMGLTEIGWDIEWRFDNHLHLLKTDDQILTQIKNLFEKQEMKTPNNLVMLAHDQTFRDSANCASLHRLVKKFKSSGEYKLEVISKYPGLKKS